MRPETLYAKSGDVHIAYQVFGKGPVNLVLVPGFVSNIETYWEHPDVARWMLRLASFARVATFDKRGTGLSDRVSEFPSFDLRMDDARAVMDAAGMERAAILGISEGGSMAALFAATYPQRCQGLVIYGGFARASWTTAEGLECFLPICRTILGQRRQSADFRAVAYEGPGLAAMVGEIRTTWREPGGSYRSRPDAEPD